MLDRESNLILVLIVKLCLDNQYKGKIWKAFLVCVLRVFFKSSIHSIQQGDSAPLLGIPRASSDPRRKGPTKWYQSISIEGCVLEDF